MSEKYKTLTSVSYDDPNFGRIVAKPGTTIDGKDLDAETLKYLRGVKAIAPVDARKSDAEEAADREREAAARREAEETSRKEAEDAARKAAESTTDDGFGDDEDAEEKARKEAAAKRDAVRKEAEGLTVPKLKDALKLAEVEFEKNADKAALVELYVAHATK